MQSWPVPVICWSSSSISLTRKEFSLLILLFSRIERLLLRAHITNSFLIYLLFINNLSLLAIHCCFSLPRHAFIIEFDLLGHHWKYLRKIKGSFFAQWMGWKGKNSLKQHMEYVWSMEYGVEVCEQWLAQPGTTLGWWTWKGEVNLELQR